MSDTRRWLLTGGAGFVGSHLVDRLLGDDRADLVTVYDNFSSGRRWHLAHHDGDGRLTVREGEVGDLASLTEAMEGHGVVVHLASNPDIARAATEPTIDFDQGTVLTSNVVEAMRRVGAERVLYPSGSGVYGELGEVEASEDHGPLVPISTYGASKLAGEALVASYAAMFGLTGCAFRFGNVVGPRQTHGVGFDFLRRLLVDPTSLEILGDGTQSKSYIHIDDVLDAVLLAYEESDTPFETFNVATGDYITVREIADLAVRRIGRDPADVEYRFTGGDRGWKGDVPVIRLDTTKIRALGWRCKRSSADAVDAALGAMLDDAGRVLD